MTPPAFFADAAAFRAWLTKNHASATELAVGYYRKETGVPSITWPESVDAALCFGWIDGVRRKVDEKSYSVRFTPRKPRSIWSAVNIGRVAEMERLGLMHAAGREAFARRLESRSGVYSFEQAEVKFDAASIKAFRAQPEAWKFFRAQAPFYVRTATWWVISAKRDETKAARLKKLIEVSGAGTRLPQFTRRL